MMAKIEVKTVRQTSVYGKDQRYVIIGEDEDKVVIQVGEKTIDGVDKIINGKKPGQAKEEKNRKYTR